MRVALLISLVAAVHLTACTQAARQLVPQTDDEKALYALGIFMASRMTLQTFEFTEQELAMVKAGMSDEALSKASMKQEEVETFLPKLQELIRTRSEAAMERSKKEGTEYLAKAASVSGAEKTSSGVIYQSVKEGTGASPTATDVVKMNYKGTLISGKEFDASKEGEPLVYPLGQMIPCWIEGVQKMKVGGSAKLVCPSDQAYGDEGRPPSIPGGSTLLFDVELLEIVKEDAAAGAAVE